MWTHQARPGFSGFCLCPESLSCVWLFAIPWTVACQAPLSMEFSRQEYWSELPFLSPEDLPDPGIESESPALQVNSSPSEPPGNASLITLFYSTSCRHWAGCSEFGVDWKRKRLRGARTTDIFYITHWFVAFQTKRNWGSDMVERKGADPEPDSDWADFSSSSGFIFPTTWTGCLPGLLSCPTLLSLSWIHGL